jgi:ParB family chromosome partitioning protein
MERRVLIVESQNDFALTMASVLKDAGYQTSLAASAAEAPASSRSAGPTSSCCAPSCLTKAGSCSVAAFARASSGRTCRSFCCRASRASRRSSSTRVAQRGHGYLAIPFEMSELSRLTTTIAPPPRPAAPVVDQRRRRRGDLDNALTGAGPTERDPRAGWPHRRCKTTTGGPPRLPRRERRSQLTDEDRAFLDRAFQSIADRKAELLAESRELRRSAPAATCSARPRRRFRSSATS